MNDLEQKVNDLWEFMQALKANSTIPYEVDSAFRVRLADAFIAAGTYPDALATAPAALVTAPSGGAVIDAEARTAVNAVITRLETLGLIETN